MTTTSLPPSNGKIILITGINGYIASVLGHLVLSKGYFLRGTSRSKISVRDLLDGAYKPYSSRVTIHEVPDITAPGAFDEAVKGKSRLQTSKKQKYSLSLSSCPRNLPHCITCQLQPQDVRRRSRPGSARDRDTPSLCTPSRSTTRSGGGHFFGGGSCGRLTHELWPYLHRSGLRSHDARPCDPRQRVWTPSTRKRIVQCEQDCCRKSSLGVQR